MIQPKLTDAQAQFIISTMATAHESVMLAFQAAAEEAAAEQQAAQEAAEKAEQTEPEPEIETTIEEEGAE